MRGGFSIRPRTRQHAVVVQRLRQRTTHGRQEGRAAVHDDFRAVSWRTHFVWGHYVVSQFEGIIIAAHSPQGLAASWPASIIKGIHSTVTAMHSNHRGALASRLGSVMASVSRYFGSSTHGLRSICERRTSVPWANPRRQNRATTIGIIGRQRAWERLRTKPRRHLIVCSGGDE